MTNAAECEGSRIWVSLTFFILLTGLTHQGKAAESSPDVVALAIKNADVTARTGLALYVGASDSKGLTSLATGCRAYVQGVVCERELAERVRAGIVRSDIADRVSVVWRRTQHLPYLDNLANLIIAEGWGDVDTKGLTLSEIVRVLRPGGLAIVGSDSGGDAAMLLAEAGKIKLAKAEKLSRPGAWIKITKVMNPDFGDWPSIAGGPEMNMVSTDRVAAPGKEVRWHNGPVWSTATYSTTVLAGGRAFHVEQDFIRPDANGYSQGQLVLVARDAFNGCDLWREPIHRSNASVPGTRFCADDKYVYCLDGKDFVARDAGTGKIARSYGAGPASASVLGDYLILGGRAVDRESGKTLWTRPTVIQPAAKDGVAYVLNGDGVEAVNISDGRTLWKSPLKAKDFPGGIGYNSAIMCKADAVYVLHHFRDPQAQMLQTVVALDRTTGALRWSDTRPQPAAVLPFADQVCFTNKVASSRPDIRVLENTLLDVKTGKESAVVRSSPSIHAGTRCWAPRATDRFVIYEGRLFVDPRSGETFIRDGVRSSCSAGQFPAYGLEYNTPHACSCEVSLRGVVALSPGSTMANGEIAPALIAGAGGPAGEDANARDWPMYRAAGTRSDACSAELPADLKLLWTTKVSRTPLPQATGAGKLVFVADTEACRVVAIGMEDGKAKWTFPTEGRVSQAPTYYKGLCLFGDHAGWVYCIQAASGRLVWQLQAAPQQRYMAAFNQFESSWPVTSGVLVLGDAAYFVAGRCSTMDGGLFVYGVDATTGHVRWRRNFTDIRPTDMLVSDGHTLYLGTASLNLVDGADVRGPAAVPQQRVLRSGPDSHGDISILDLLMASQDHGRTRDIKRLPNDGRAEGHVIAFDKDRSITGWRHRRVSGRDKDFVPADNGHCHVLSNSGKEWINKETGRQMQAMLLAGSRAYCVGIPEFRDSQDMPALFVLSATDGKELQQVPLEAAPSIDGLSAVAGKLILTTVDGQVQCYGAK